MSKYVPTPFYTTDVLQRSPALDDTALVLGNATLDVIQRVERLPAPGETVLALSTARCAGGKELNQAVAASPTGAPTLLVAPIGQDGEAAVLANSLNNEAGDRHRPTHHFAPAACVPPSSPWARAAR